MRAGSVREEAWSILPTTPPSISSIAMPKGRFATRSRSRGGGAKAIAHLRRARERDGPHGGSLRAPRNPARKPRRAAAARPARISDHFLGRAEGGRRAGRAEHAALDRRLRPDPRRQPRARAVRLARTVRPSSRRCSTGHPYLKQVFVVGGERAGGDAVVRDANSRLARAAPPIPVSADEMRVLALFLRLDRPAQGRAPCPFQPEIHRRHLWRRGAEDPQRRHRLFRRPSCSSPMGSAMR